MTVCVCVCVCVCVQAFQFIGFLKQQGINVDESVVGVAFYDPVAQLVNRHNEIWVWGKVSTSASVEVHGQVVVSRTFWVLCVCVCVCVCVCTCVCVCVCVYQQCWGDVFATACVSAVVPAAGAFLLYHGGWQAPVGVGEGSAGLAQAINMTGLCHHCRALWPRLSCPVRADAAHQTLNDCVALLCC